ncbi:MAG: N-acetylglucosamine-6-phosphate deacetylase [Planctomycetota bacterium]
MPRHGGEKQGTDPLLGGRSFPSPSRLTPQASRLYPSRPVVISGGAVYTTRIVLPTGYVLVRDGRIEDVCPGDPPPALKKTAQVIDARGLLVTPGLIDLHIHGSGGGDVADADPESILRISKILPRFGVTGFLASVYPAPKRKMLAQIRAVRDAAASAPAGARILGVHLEGPYLNPVQKGALNPRSFRAPDLDEMAAFIAEAPGLIRLMTIAPELPGAIEMIKFCREQNIRTAVGHSDASHEEMLAAIAAGLSHVTHAFNALRRSHHRDPGVMGTVLTVDEVSLELIADFVHLHPKIVELLLITKPLDRLVLVSDAVRIAGLPGRRFLWDGTPIRVIKGVPRRPDGAIAGSILTLNRAVANVTSTSRATLEEAIKMASLIPARCIHLEADLGCLVHDKDADIALFDPQMNCRLTMVSRRIVHDSRRLGP